ncbi:MAG: hypothetical protein AAGA23_04235 [Pseudomonadota bacterium]
MNTQVIQTPRQILAPDASKTMLLLEQILRPIIKLFMLTFRVTYPAMDRVIKSLFIDIALEEAAKQDPTTEPSMGTLAYFTGISPHLCRQTFDELVERDRPPGYVDQTDVCPEAKVLGIWARDPMWQDDDGEPMLLPTSGKYNSRTLQTLVRKHVDNIAYGQVVDALIDAGCVTFVRHKGKRCLKMKRPFFTPGGGEGRTDDLLTHTARSIRHLLQTFTFNLENPQLAPTNNLFQQERYIRCLHPDDVPEFRSRMKDLLRRQVEESVPRLEGFENGPETKESIHAGVGYYYFEDRGWGRYETLSA